MAAISAVGAATGYPKLPFLRARDWREGAACLTLRRAHCATPTLPHSLLPAACLLAPCAI